LKIARRKRRISVRMYWVGVLVAQLVKRIVTVVENEKVDDIPAFIFMFMFLSVFVDVDVFGSMLELPCVWKCW
jgi:hypothetical protein